MKPIVLKKGGTGAIQIVGTQYKGVDYIDVRNFYTDRVSGELKPTPKGIMVPIDQVEAVAAAMLKQLKALGTAVEAARNPRMYVLLPGPKADSLGRKTLKVSDFRVFETFPELRAYKKAKVGDVAVAITGDYELQDNMYVFAPTAKKRRVAIRSASKWVKVAEQ